jgi:putative N6-adenine-specific DNA methylase
LAPPQSFEIFLATPPGLEPTLGQEARAAGFEGVAEVPGGVTVQGGWAEVWRANLMLRCATRVLARIAQFEVTRGGDFDARLGALPWGDWLPAGGAVKPEVTTRASRLSHGGLMTKRAEKTLRQRAGLAIGGETAVPLKIRIDSDMCTVSLDTSGSPLHQRGHKGAVGKAPMRETLAAAFLRQCGYGGQGPVVDPMCGSGTFVIEAAEIAAGLPPGRSRAFAFERLAGFDAAAWAAMRAQAVGSATVASRWRAFGYDRDAGVIRAATDNADRAGVAAMTAFTAQSISDLTPPPGLPGLVIVNPPYGSRIGDKKKLGALYQAFGQTLMARFAGWRVAIVTPEPSFAKATGLPFAPPGPPIPNGALRVKLYQTAPLPRPRRGG